MPPSPSAEAARNAASNRLAWSCAGPGSPTPRNDDSGPSGDTTPCCGSRPAGPGPEPSTQCSTPCGRCPPPRADARGRDLTHPRQAQRQQPANSCRTLLQRARAPTPPPGTTPTRQTRPHTPPQPSERWIEAKVVIRVKRPLPGSSAPILVSHRCFRPNVAVSLEVFDP